jgi:hypothetical protein
MFDEKYHEFFKSLGYAQTGWQRGGMSFEDDEDVLRDIIRRVVDGELSIIEPPTEPPVVPAGWEPTRPKSASVTDDDIPF